MAIARNKQYSSGLHVAAGRYLLGPEVVDDQLKRKKHAEEVQKSERENLKIDAHMALANKGYAIRSLHKQSAVWTVAQTKTMATRYKREGNLPLPTTKQLLLTRFNDTMRCVAMLQHQRSHFLSTLWLLPLHNKKI